MSPSVTPNDGPDPTSGRSASPPPPGSVADEAALLLDLLSRRSRSGEGMPPREPRGERHDGAAPDRDETIDPGAHPGGQAGECTCGGSTPAACRVCPLCQLIAFVQQVNPDTIDKVADFVGFAATALRDLASAQRDRRPDSDSDPEPDSDSDSATPGRDAPGGTA